MSKIYKLLELSIIKILPPLFKIFISFNPDISRVPKFMPVLAIKL